MISQPMRGKTNEQIREELIKSLMKEFDNNYPDYDEYFYEDEEDYYF